MQCNANILKSTLSLFVTNEVATTFVLLVRNVFTQLYIQRLVTDKFLFIDNKRN